MPHILVNVIARKIISMLVWSMVVRNLGEKEIAFIARDVNGHVGNNVEDFQDQYGGYDYG